MNYIYWFWHVDWSIGGSGTALMAHKPSNDAVLEQLKNGIAQFKLVSSPVASISTSLICQANPTALFGGYSHRFFARTPNFCSTSYISNVEKVKCDGRCLFRALANGIAEISGTSLSPWEESKKEDALRRSVRHICNNAQERPDQYEETIAAIKHNEKSLKRYCTRIDRNEFGGESELLVLSNLWKQPIVVYMHEHTTGGRGSGRYIPIAEYGREVGGGSRNNMKAVRLLKLEYNGRNHYDLLPIARETERE